jgi:hypothetical protein
MSHRVEVLTGDTVALTRLTRHVRGRHGVPRYGNDPIGWFETVLGVLDAPSAAGPVDVLVPTQEQVPVLALCRAAVHDRNVAMAVPSFDAVARVQSKVAAVRTLAEIGVPQPRTLVVANRAELVRSDFVPAFVKWPIGTAGTGVVRVGDVAALRMVASTVDDDAFALGGLVVQQAVDGPLAMVQSVFDDGRLVAWHANLRVREGSRGGATHKRSVDLPVVREHCEALGTALGWHGALSLDVILPDALPGRAVVIDVNPRLVEPINAWFSGVDLVAALLEVSLGRHPARLPSGRSGVATHQLLLALVNAARRGRRAIAVELALAIRRDGDYAGSCEELTPTSGDPLSWLPIVAVATTALVNPRLAGRFSKGTVRNYALDVDGWRALLDDERGRREPRRVGRPERAGATAT